MPNRPFLPFFIPHSSFLILLSLSGCFTSTERGGEALYVQHCANCHGVKGDGLATLIPPLAHADYLTRHRAALPCIIRQGMRGPLTVNGRHYNGVMPAFPPTKLSDADVANILNYVRNAWGNHAPDAITVHDVSTTPCPVPPDEAKPGTHQESM